MKTCQVSGDGRPNEDQIKRIKKIMETIPEDNHFEDYSG